jgi:hypothetical protein
VTGDLPRKDWEQQPIASVWRDAIRSIVSALVRNDFGLASADRCVERPTEEEGEALRDGIAGYGDVTLAGLPDASWDSSVAIWTGDHWEALVDLWTVEEGRSDLVLSLEIRESNGEYMIEVHGIHVPCACSVRSAFCAH